jgi:hypothetical protein
MRTRVSGKAAVTAAVADIQHHVRAQRPGHADGGGPVAGLADYLDVGLGVQDQPEAHAEQRLVIGEQYPDHVV